MLSKTSACVVNALIELAKLPKGERVGVGIIAKRIKAPQNYLSKMFQGLASKGLLDSQKGIQGGFCFKKDPNKVSLYEIVEPIDNMAVWSGCALSLKKCSEKSPCAVHNKWKVIKEAYLDFLRNTSIASLAKV